MRSLPAFGGAIASGKTWVLADADAEVVKIERRPVGDEMRLHEPMLGAQSSSFMQLNRGKRSVALDLKQPSAREQLIPLLKRADVLVEQFRPGVMARLGIGYEDVKKLNPQVIYCSISGYGQTGPMRDAAGHDLTYIAETGLLSLSCGSTTSPVTPPAYIADIAGGAYPAVINILLALRERSSARGGQHLDVSMSDNMFPLLYWALGQAHTTKAWAKSGAETFTGGSPRYRLYPTADGRLLAVAALEDCSIAVSSGWMASRWRRCLQQ